MPVLGQTPVRIHWQDSGSVVFERIGAEYTDPNDPTKLVQDVKVHRIAQTDVRTTTSETIDGESGEVIVLTDSSPAAAIAVSLDSSIDDGFVCDILNESTQTVTFTPTSGDINDGSGAGSSATLAAGTSCRLSKDSSGSPAVANWRMMKGAGSGGGGTWGSITGTLSDQTDLQAELDAKASIDGFQKNSYIYAADTGSANAYAVSVSPSPTIVAGSSIVFKAANANTGASTLAVNGASAVAIKKNGVGDLALGDIVAGQMVEVKYDGTYYQIVAGAVGPQGVSGAGQFFPSFVVPASANFSTLNWATGGGASITDKSDRMIVDLSDDANNVRVLYHSAAIPSTPYTVEAALFGAEMGSANGTDFGICVVNSGTSKIRSIEMAFNNSTQPAIRCEAWTLPLTASTVSGAVISRAYHPTFLRITDDGTNRKYWWSSNGKDYVQFFSEATNTGITPDHLGFMFFNSNSRGANGHAIVSIYHFQIATSILPQFA